MFGSTVGSNNLPNPGSIKDLILWAFEEDLATEGDYMAVPVNLGDRSKIMTAHTFVANKGIYILGGTIYKNKHKGEMPEENDVTGLIERVNFMMPGNTPELSEIVERLQVARGRFWVQDTNGYVVQGGTINLAAGAKIEDYTDGETIKGWKGYNVQLFASMPRRSFYTGHTFAALKALVAPDGDPLLTNGLGGQGG